MRPERAALRRPGCVHSLHVLTAGDAVAGRRRGAAGLSGISRKKWQRCTGGRKGILVDSFRSRASLFRSRGAYGHRRTRSVSSPRPFCGVVSDESFSSAGAHSARPLTLQACNSLRLYGDPRTCPRSETARGASGASRSSSRQSVPAASRSTSCGRPLRRATNPEVVDLRCRGAGRRAWQVARLG